MNATIISESKLPNCPPVYVVSFEKDGKVVGTGKFQRNWRKGTKGLTPNGTEGRWACGRWADDDMFDFLADASRINEIREAAEKL